MAAGGAAASAVVGAVVAEVANRITSSEQAVRDDRAVEEAKRSSARQKPPLTANAYYYNRSDEAMVWALPRPLTDQERQRLVTPPSPGSLGLAPDSFTDVVHGVMQYTAEPHRLLTRIRISVVGQWSGPVFVRQIRARVVRRTPPISGAFLFHNSQGGGEPLEIGFDLDEPDSLARLVGSDGHTLGAAYLDRRSLTLSPNEPLTIDVQAYTARSYCEWVIELDLDLDGKRRTHVVDDHGQPFRSTGLARHYQDRYYMHITNGWTAEGAGPPSYKT
ncbi:hypothetical protein [Micromonospora cathayae]|uniref:Uncharacterized protein n=1 Tax=Micromonospora cathayae TaxID=3028804 RepID=A0ABY7ZKM6_9ACTN|nr:hypothetical protein [Micromonospora sp. HUAS 3]WDZ83542.1 hypothetical protein PVK37_24210 [Micromonospora sp. HUAS 3]